ncbi:Phosphomannomutase [Echinococcus granulosus]|uniref:Phosphomannomutase n=1 Tax=Echinococcus granulosus TaxID=6210 RepID=A0A068X180_ECHGR|nr:Phosphomannomutase [Echinococcus granulosus]CDS23687.1 phosphomannomutase [Echinococcus granulosus]
MSHLFVYAKFYQQLHGTPAGSIPSIPAARGLHQCGGLWLPEQFVFLISMELLRNRGRKVPHVITPEMYEFLCELDKKVTVGLVGGSDLCKIREQMGGSAALHRFKHVFTENGLVAYRYDQLICSKDIASHVGEELLQRLINFILRRLSEITLPVKRGTFVEFRKGMLNVSPIGRSCSQAERDAFYTYDKEHKIRETLVEVLRKEFGDCDLQFSIGGQISIDIFPTGWNKCFCLRFLEDYDTIHFFGDKTMKGGNDFEIFSHPRTIGHSVVGPEDTKKQLQDLFFS